jgi:D-sedoheptulose 7-phosphate isomerase
MWAMAGSRSYLLEVTAALDEHQARMNAALEALDARASELAEAAGLLLETLRQGNKILVAGNGAGAAGAQHFSAALMGRFLHDRDPYAALALTTDGSILTGVGNDYAFDDIFARQVAGLGRPGDLLLAYSTSGESENLIRAADVANDLGMRVVAITGPTDSRLGRMGDVSIQVPAHSPPVIQEIQMAITHLLCAIVEQEMSGAHVNSSSSPN